MLLRFFFAPAGFALSPAAVRDVVRRVRFRSLYCVCSQSRCGQRLCRPAMGGAGAPMPRPGAAKLGPSVRAGSVYRRCGFCCAGPFSRSRNVRTGNRPVVLCEAPQRPAHPSAGRGSAFSAEPFGNLLRQFRKNGPLRRVQSSLHVGRRSDKARVFSRRASARCGFSGVAASPAGRTERPRQKFLIKFNKTLFRTFFRRKIPDILFTFAAC